MAPPPSLQLRKIYCVKLDPWGEGAVTPWDEPDAHQTTVGVGYPTPSTPRMRPLGFVSIDSAYSVEKNAV